MRIFITHIQVPIRVYAKYHQADPGTPGDSQGMTIEDIEICGFNENKEIKNLVALRDNILTAKHKDLVEEAWEHDEV
jgi:hypothetical protein